MVGKKPEIGNAPLGLCVEGLFCRPDASGGLMGSWTGCQRALGPQLQPMGIPEVDKFCSACRGGWGWGGVEVTESISYTPEWIITERRYNGRLCKLTKQIVFFPSK